MDTSIGANSPRSTMLGTPSIGGAPMPRRRPGQVGTLLTGTGAGGRAPGGAPPGGGGGGGGRDPGGPINLY